MFEEVKVSRLRQHVGQREPLIMCWCCEDMKANPVSELASFNVKAGNETYATCYTHLSGTVIAFINI